MVETINRVAEVWFDWQWAMLWQTAVLIGIVAVIDRLIRKRAWPQLRYTLWLLVFVKLVLPPTLASPLSLTSHIPALTQRTAEARTQIEPHPGDERGAPAISAKSNVLTAADEPTSVQAIDVETADTGPAKSQSVEAGAAAVGAAAPDLSWAVYALGIWLAGVVTLAVGLLVRLRQIATEHNIAGKQDGPAWFESLVSETATELGLQRAPRVVFSERIGCPAVFGVLRPVLLFPADQLSMTREQTRHILLHELAHIKRGDLLANAACMVLATVYWFNPLLWLIRRHIQNLRELCCDATVARHLKEQTAAYRQTLLTTGRALLARPVDPGLGLLGLFENSGWLPIRVQWLQKETWQHPRLRRTLVAVVSVLMLGCVLPMASIHGADKKPSSDAFKVTLPGGGTIELIGARKTGTNDWWRPDGTPLAEAPYDSDAETPDPDTYEVALRYEDLPKDSWGQMDVEGGFWGGTIPMWYTQVQKAGGPVEGVTYVSVRPPEGKDAVTVKVYLATGSWTTDATNPRFSSGWDARTNHGATISAMIFSVPYEKEGRTYATVTYAAQRSNDCDVRLIALGVNNVEHRSPSEHVSGLWTSAGFKQMTLDFDLPLDDVAAFNLQTRPYRCAQFNNVSLCAGKIRKIDVITTEPHRTDENEERNESKVDIHVARDKSARVLRAFHTACVRYLKENMGAELPKRPWLLKFPLEDSVCVSPLQYVTSAGYFRPGGFPSLRRADFESSEASRTPILFCKFLLERKDGKGTNVLFGDGHIQWVTAEKLEKLKKSVTPSQE